jgi:hypothetical protein
VSAIAAFFLNLADDRCPARRRVPSMQRDDIYTGLCSEMPRPIPGQRGTEADLVQRRIRSGQVPGVHLHRGPVLLRHGVGHGQQSHDLRVQPRRRAAGSKYWHKINRKTRTPTNSIWLGVVLSAIVGATSLYVAGTGAGRFSTAFFAMTASA